VACALLHHNYLNYVSNIEDASEACAWLSESDAVLAKWDPTHALAGYAGSIATRGLLHANRQPVQHKFMPLHKPQRPEEEAARRRAHLLGMGMGMDVLESRHEARELLCETLPLLAKCAHTLAPAHARALQDLTAFTALRSGIRCSTRYMATASERIDENDAAPGGVEDASASAHAAHDAGGSGTNAAGGFGGCWRGVGAGLLGGQVRGVVARAGHCESSAHDVLDDIEDFSD
jgi:hypothetical protein